MILLAFKAIWGERERERERERAWQWVEIGKYGPR